MCLTDAFFTDGPQYDLPTLAEFGREPLPFGFDWYKAHIAQCLEDEFGRGTVQIGKKAVHIHKNAEEKIQADVLPAFTYELYGARSGPALTAASPSSPATAGGLRTFRNSTMRTDAPRTIGPAGGTSA